MCQLCSHKGPSNVQARVLQLVGRGHSPIFSTILPRLWPCLVRSWASLHAHNMSSKPAIKQRRNPRPREALLTLYYHPAKHAPFPTARLPPQRTHAALSRGSTSAMMGFTSPSSHSLPTAWRAVNER